MVSLPRGAATGFVVAVATLGGPVASTATAHAATIAAPQPQCAESHSSASQHCRARISNSSVPQGGTLTVTGGGFSPGEAVSVVLHSSATRLSTVTAAANGAVTATVRIPRTLTPGSHTLVLTGVTSANKLTAAFTVPTAADRSAGLSLHNPAVIAPAGAGLALVLAGGLTIAGIRHRRWARSGVSTTTGDPS